MKNTRCNICPRKCNLNRESNAGFCGQTNEVYISKVMLHKFEEPCISGNCDCVQDNKGSGAIFFSGCNLKCLYCQNYDISQANAGKAVTIKTLANIFKQLEQAGALNINLVTPTHYSMQIIEALKIYKPSIPIVWNSSGYESKETIEALKGFVDVFLMDFKYFDNNLAKAFSNAENYPEIAKKALLTAKSICPINVFDKDGIMQKGLIVRHLVLPNCIHDSKNILDWISTNMGNDTIVSIMSQYVPMHKALTSNKINRRLKPIEYKSVVAYAKKLCLNNSYIQELSSSDTSYTPNFAENYSDFKY